MRTASARKRPRIASARARLRTHLSADAESLGHDLHKKPC